MTQELIADMLGVRREGVTVAVGRLQDSRASARSFETWSAQAGPHVNSVIDSFFESLAEDQRERAVGVILSGAGTDGTVGLEAIKAEGGITFAQDDSAKYDSMPRSAVAAGCVDFVLSPEYIAKELARIAQRSSVGRRTGFAACLTYPT